MKFNKLLEGKNRQRNLALLFIAFIVIAVAGPIAIRQDTYDEWPSEGSSVSVSTSYKPQTPYANDAVTVTAVVSITGGQDTSAYEENSFIIAETTVCNLYWKLSGDAVFKRVLMTGSDNTFTGTISAQAEGATVTYYVEANVGGEMADSSSRTYTVSAQGGEETTPPSTGEINPQDVIPPVFLPLRVWLDNGTEVTWPEFQMATVYGTIHFEIEFVEGGNKIWAVTLELSGTAPGYWGFGIKEGEQYVWQLDWDTTNMPDGQYAATLDISYFTDDTPSGSNPDLYHTMFSIFSFGSSDGIVSFANSDILIFIVIIIVIAVISVSYFAKYNKKGK